jgi:hypothetical protein
METHTPLPDEFCQFLVPQGIGFIHRAEIARLKTKDGYELDDDNSLNMLYGQNSN